MASLTKIYADLCAICDQPRQKCQGSHLDSTIASPIGQLKNLYEGLAVAYECADAEVESITEPDECAECHVDKVRVCRGPQKEIRLADDDLGNAIEFASALQEIQQIVEEVEQCWSNTAKGQIHFVSAAYLTHVGYATLLQIERRLRELDEDISITGLQQKCCVLLERSPKSGEKSAWHGLLEQLSARQQAVGHRTDKHKSAVPSKSLARAQKPHEFITADNDDSHLVTTLLDNALDLVHSKHAPSAIVRNSTPAYADLGYLMFHPEQKDDKFRLSLSLHLLAQSYSSYVLSLQQPSMAFTARLTALRLAQSAAQSVHELLRDKKCFPCHCAQTLAFHLQNLEEDLTSFAQHNKWDLLFQSPYVSGSHILEMLDLCHYYGSKLFVYRHYIGALVHSYNVMTQFAGLEQNPLLEYLCDEFRHTFFPGGQRPTRSFRACWSRYIGARIKFKKSHKRNNKDSWCMAIPPHEARKAAGLGVGRNEGSVDKGECVIFSIKQRDYDVSAAQWEGIDAHGPSHKSCTVSQDATPSAAAVSCHRLSSLLPLLDKTLASTTPDRVPPPKARLNHFRVFHDCVKVVSDISDATHTNPKERNMNCICFASAVLEGGDRILAARAAGKINGKGACWTKDERDGVLKTTAQAMKTVFGDKPVQSWSWDL